MWSQFTVHFSTLFPRTLLPVLPTGLFVLYFPMNISCAFFTPHQRILLSRVILKMAVGPSLFKNLPAFYVTQRFITVYTTARHLSLSSARWIRPSHHVPLRSILISPSSLLLYISSHLFSFRFSIQTTLRVSVLFHVYRMLLPPFHAPSMPLMRVTVKISHLSTRTFHHIL